MDFIKIIFSKRQQYPEQCEDIKEAMKKNRKAANALNDALKARDVITQLSDSL